MSALRHLLYPAAWGYEAAIRLRNWAFDRGILRTKDTGLPVISIGNLVSGGVGKTPLVEYTARFVGSLGRKPGIVSRGYGRSSSGIVVVSDGRSSLTDASVAGDEPVQMALKIAGTIVVVGERRVGAAARARDLGAEVIIADDAFQHRYLGRDLNVLVLDSRTDITTAPMLPVGRKREPHRSVRRADYIVLSRTSGSRPDWIRRLGIDPGIPFAEFRFRPGSLRGVLRSETEPHPPAGQYLAFSGIGSHRDFLLTLKEAGVLIGFDVAFPDHYAYTLRDFREIRALMKREGCHACVTTEKDMVRIGTKGDAIRQFLSECRVRYLPIEVEFTTGEDEFQRRIKHICLTN